MAPGRRRGAKGVKTKNELSLGDLVLAKVKGFPAWPAKISRPEDWGRAPDTRKYFVQFYGTSEIAFVAPADIQAFTSESKTKLSARCKGKTVKYFAQAVSEICEEFEELEHKNLSGVRDDNSTQSLASEANSLDPVVDDTLEINGIDKIDRKEADSKLEIKGARDLGSLECSSQRQGEGDCADVKSNKTPSSPANLLKDSVSVSSDLKEEKSPDIKVKNRYSDKSQKELTNGHRSNPGIGSKKKPEGAIRSRNGGSAISREHAGQVVLRKFASGGSMKVPSTNTSRSGLDIASERKEKRALKEHRHSETADDSREDATSRKKMKAQHGRERKRFETNEMSSPAKMSKLAETGDDASMVKARLSRKNESRPVRVQTSVNESNHSSDEDDLSPIKRHRRASEAMSTSTARVSENKLGASASVSRKNDLVPPNKVRSPVMQLPTKRRAVRLFDDEDDELPKTPVHGGFTNKVPVAPRMTDSKVKPVTHVENHHVHEKLVSRNSGSVDNGLNEHVHSSHVSDKVSIPVTQQGVDKSIGELSAAAHSSPSPWQPDSEILPSMEVKLALVSPKRSPQQPIGDARPTAELQSKHFSKAPGDISQKKTLAGDNRSGTPKLDLKTSERSKPASSGEKRKTTPKPELKSTGSVLMSGTSNENITSLRERLDVGNDKTTFPIDPRTSDSVMSMKHLIAAAQARKKQAHSQNSYGLPLFFSAPDSDMHGRTPSPNHASLAFESSKTLQLDVQGLRPTSPPSDVHQLASVNEHENEELEERRVSSGHQGTGSSLSGGTEAAVARDSFEGMIETLSRTKESIGRATRLAIDCAKYGIANEVVELLIQKLENEPNLHRRVDLFFLVDSITQCSHSQRGVAGASYIPTVQAALPRLIGAAAPSGAGAQENRRQCHKVLRLWLERKILPEPILRRHMDDLGVVKDDTSVGVSLRRPSRTERSIDDPIREMEGMVVDEYGSNATFQLPGLLSAHVFDEEEEYEDSFPTNLPIKEVDDTSPSKVTPSRDPDNQNVTPSDRRHCILEDVDGELEMEDVSGHQRDERERPLFTNGASELASLEPTSDVNLESASNISSEWLPPSPEGSPPLPPGSPPSTPPLPTSPPQPPPPSSPPPPPPLSSTQQLLSPQLPPGPPPPPPHVGPPPPSHPPPVGPPAPPPMGPTPPLLSQQSFPPQSALMSQHMPPPPPALPHEIKPTGNQHSRSEASSQQFPPSGVTTAQEYVGYNSSRHADYGQGDGYMNPQHRQHFLTGPAPFAQRPVPPNHVPYPNSAQQHSYPQYSMPNFSDGPRRYPADAQWRMQVNEFNADCQRPGWVPGGRPSGPTYPHEGYFGPPPERPSASAVNYQPPAPNTVPPPAGQLPVHGVPMMPSRPDMSAINWRPV